MWHWPPALLFAGGDAGRGHSCSLGGTTGRGGRCYILISPCLAFSTSPSKHVALATGALVRRGRRRTRALLFARGHHRPRGPVLHLDLAMPCFLYITVEACGTGHRRSCSPGATPDAGTLVRSGAPPAAGAGATS